MMKKLLLFQETSRRHFSSPGLACLETLTLSFPVSPAGKQLISLEMASGKNLTLKI